MAEKNNMETKKTGRGGNHGGGRPRKNNPKTTKCSLNGTLEEIESLKKLAKAQNKTFSRFIIESILYHDNKH